MLIFWLQILVALRHFDFKNIVPFDLKYLLLALAEPQL